MKFYMVTALSFVVFLSSSGFAANQIQPYESAVGAESIVRQVLKKKLLLSEDKGFNSKLLGALEGSGDSPERTTMVTYLCERTLGVDDCKITFVIDDHAEQGNEGSSFELHLRILQGEVISAKIEGFIG